MLLAPLVLVLPTPVALIYPSVSQTAALSQVPWVMDAHLFYDHDADRLWMTWGGYHAWVTELDPATGHVKGTTRLFPAAGFVPFDNWLPASGFGRLFHVTLSYCMRMGGDCRNRGRLLGLGLGFGVISCISE